MELPEAFVQRMRSLLGSDAPDFFAAHDVPALKAFHVNHARISSSDIENWLSSAGGISFEPAAGGAGYIYSFSGDTTIGSLPMHHAGAVYSQDPAAMLPCSGLSITPDMRILDMCAAPGGKTSQLAMAVDGGSGYVLANEPVLSRNRILISNIERMGYRNVITSCLDPAELSAVYPDHFDLVLVDAPCSGEGMFRKYPASINEWSTDNIEKCVERQREILRSAAHCLRPGGKLVYSTCTYAPEEDEEQILFMCKELGLKADSAPQAVRAYALNTAEGAYRCYPHLYKGEGQFMAYLYKEGDPFDKDKQENRMPEGIEKPRPAQLKQITEALGEDAEKFDIYSYRDRFIIPGSCPLRLPKRGISSIGVTALIFDEKKKRYVPHHQFFSAYGNMLSRTLDLSPDDPLLRQYISGMEISCDTEFSKGYGAVLCHGVAVGGVRCAGGRLKNLYPKGLRETHL